MINSPKTTDKIWTNVRRFVNRPLGITQKKES
jgi:hypothetical protein